MPTPKSHRGPLGCIAILVPCVIIISLVREAGGPAILGLFACWILWGFFAYNEESEENNNLSKSKQRESDARFTHKNNSGQKPEVDERLNSNIDLGDEHREWGHWGVKHHLNDRELNDRDVCHETATPVDPYAPDGYAEDGFDQWGFDREGFDREGFDREGFDREGYDKTERLHHEILATGIGDQYIDGYDVEGYDRDGYDKEGYDRDGYDKDDYGREGFDRWGINKYGNRKTVDIEDHSPSSGDFDWDNPSQ